MATINLKYADDMLQYLDEDGNWKQMKEGTFIGCNSNELISWVIYEEAKDNELVSLDAITPVDGAKNKPDVKLPEGGHWETEWEVVPHTVSKKEIQGCPMPKDATKSHPAIYGYDITFTIKSGKQITIDPGSQVPQQ